MADVQLQNLPTEAAPADAHTVAGDNGTATSKFTLSSIKAYIANALALTGVPTAPTAAAGTNTTQIATTAHVFAERSNTATLTNKTLTAPTLSGIVTTDGAQIQTSAAMGALAVDVAKAVNTKTIAADSTLTFSGTPATDTWFGLLIDNSDTNPHTITIPSSYSHARQAAITAFVLGASSRAFLTWRRNASGYDLFGDTNYLNNYAGTAAPTANDDVADGYGPGSLWLDATGNAFYICESNAAGAAVWNAAGGGGSGITQLTSDVTAGPGSGSQAATIAANAVSDTKLRDSAALSVIGRSANSTGDPADIAAASDGQVLRRSGTTLGFGTVATAGLGDDQVTYAKLQNAAAGNVVLTRAAATSGDFGETALSASQLLGRGSTGDIAAITLGTNLSMSGTTLNASGGGSSAFGLNPIIIYGIPRQQGNSFFFSDGGAGLGAAGTNTSGNDIMGGSVVTHSVAYAPASAANNIAYGLRSDFSGHTCMPNGGKSPVVYAEFMYSPNSSASTQRFAIGLGTIFGGDLSGDPSAQTNCIFLGADAADTNLQIMHNDGSGACTKVDLGANFPKASADAVVYYVRLALTSPTSVAYRVEELTNNPTPATGTLSTNLPASQQSLGAHIQGNTGSAGTTGGIKIGPFRLWSQFSVG